MEKVSKFQLSAFSSSGVLAVLKINFFNKLAWSRHAGGGGKSVSPKIVFLYEIIQGVPKKPSYV